MESRDIKETILSWDTMLSKRMKKYIHYRSMRNFLLCIDEIKNSRDKEKIREILSNYIYDVKSKDYIFDALESTNLAKKSLSIYQRFFKKILNS
jgi:hypothetical protein